MAYKTAATTAIARAPTPAAALTAPPVYSGGGEYVAEGASGDLSVLEGAGAYAGGGWLPLGASGFGATPGFWVSFGAGA